MSSSRPSLAPKGKRALVIGASSGIGAACALELAKQGYVVGIVARRQTELDQVASAINQKYGEGRCHAWAHDATDYAAVPALFDTITNTLEGLEVFIYAAGIMAPIGEQEYNFAKDEQLVAVNFLGAVAWSNQAADLFRRLKHGSLIGISSVAGERGRRKNPVYGASKAALTHYLEALRNRLSQDGVRVVTIKPGYIDTQLIAGIKSPLWLISPEEAARRIVGAAWSGPEVLYVPRRWMVLMGVVRAIPSALFRRLSV